MGHFNIDQLTVIVVSVAIFVIIIVFVFFVVIGQQKAEIITLHNYIDAVHRHTQAMQGVINITIEMQKCDRVTLKNLIETTKPSTEEIIKNVPN